MLQKFRKKYSAPPIISIFFLLIFNFSIKFCYLRKFLALFGIIFCHQTSDCFNSGHIIKSKLEIIGRALYLQQQKIDQSFFRK
jgi:hypothetical protein